MLKRTVLSVVFTLFFTSVALAANYIEPPALKKVLDEKQQVILVDIQPADDFADQHLPGAIETDAFPAKSDAQKARMDKALPAIMASHAPVVVICPSGKTGAENGYAYLMTKGVPEPRLLILKGGMNGWPYDQMVVKGR